MWARLNQKFLSTSAIVSISFDILLIVCKDIFICSCSLKHFLYPARKFYARKTDIKLYVITSIHLPIQEALDCLQEHALILPLQKLYQIHLSNSKELDYQTLEQFDLVDTYFYSK